MSETKRHNLPPFSVLMSVYFRENPEYLKASLNSLLQQTVTATEIVLVKDGPLTDELNQIIEQYRLTYEGVFKIITLPTNLGLGIALKEGLLQCNHNLVARMDADDIAVRNRFEVQLRFLMENSAVDIVGSVIKEFYFTPSATDRLKLVPEKHADISRMAKIRNPMNHMTVFFRADAVKNSGNYQPAPYFEDYYLWIRMLKKGARFHNLQSPLVNARVGNDMVGKRHGITYAKHELAHFRRMRDYGFLTQLEYLKAIMLRLPVRLLPKQLLTVMYGFILRK